MWYIIYACIDAALHRIIHRTHCITPKRVTSLRGFISESSRPGSTAPFEEILHRWHAVSNGNAVSDFTALRFEL